MIDDPMQMMRMLKSENGIRDVLLEPVFPTDNGGTVSQAEVLADIVNIYRMDAKLFGRLHGVELSISQISDKRMATVLAEMVEGNPGELIDIFNEIEDLHHEVYEEVMDDEDLEAYTEMKQSALYTHRAADRAALAAGDDEPEADTEGSNDDDATHETQEPDEAAE